MSRKQHEEDDEERGGRSRRTAPYGLARDLFKGGRDTSLARRRPQPRHSVSWGRASELMRCSPKLPSSMPFEKTSLARFFSVFYSPSPHVREEESLARVHGGGSLQAGRAELPSLQRDIVRDRRTLQCFGSASTAHAQSVRHRCRHPADLLRAVDGVPGISESCAQESNSWPSTGRGCFGSALGCSAPTWSRPDFRLNLLRRLFAGTDNANVV